MFARSPKGYTGMKIAVLVSGNGTNLQALIDAQQKGIFNANIALVISSKNNAYALERAKAYNIPIAVCKSDTEILNYLKKYNIDLVVTAGFMRILGKCILDEYKNKIINIHPSLIPSFCGKGYYGIKVHKAALDCGVKITGATVHIVNEIIDGGKILIQKAVEVKHNDTPESLQKRVMEQAEWEILPKAVAMLCNELKNKGG